MAHYEFPLVGSTVVFDTDSEGFTQRSRGRMRRVRWDQIVAAGEIALPPMALANLPNVEREMQKLQAGMATAGGPLTELVVPRVAGFIARAEQAVLTSERVWIVARSGLRRRLLELFIPNDAPAREAFVAELRGQIGPRWRSEPVSDPRALRREFHISSLWGWPAVFIAIPAVLLLGILVLAAVATLAVAWALVLHYALWIVPIVLFIAALKFFYTHLRSSPRSQ